MLNEEKTINEELCAISRQLLMKVNEICTDTTIFHEYIDAEPQGLEDTQNSEFNFN